MRRQCNNCICSNSAHQRLEAPNVGSSHHQVKASCLHRTRHQKTPQAWRASTNSLLLDLSEKQKSVVMVNLQSVQCPLGHFLLSKVKTNCQVVVLKKRLLCIVNNRCNNLQPTALHQHADVCFLPVLFHQAIKRKKAAVEAEESETDGSPIKKKRVAKKKGWYFLPLIIIYLQLCSTG